MKIREFRFDESDYQSLHALMAKIYPQDPLSVQSLRFEDASRPRVWWQKRLVEVDGKVVASGSVGEPFWSREAGKYFLGIDVDPGYLDQGIGSCLFSHLETLARERGDVRRLVTHTQEDKRAATEFLEEKGFKVVIREPISELDLPEFDATPFLPRLEQAASYGVRLARLKHLSQEFPNWQVRFWQLDTMLLQDVPSPDPFSPRSLETFVRQKVDNPSFAPHLTHIAVHGDSWIGISEMYVDPHVPDVGGTGMTGIARSWRRRGLATALKLMVLQEARSHGVKRVITDNEESNPMFHINLMLGFQEKPSWLGWELTLPGN